MSCQTCNAQMSQDQRYCLDCGARAATARLPFLDALREAPPTAPVPFGRTTTSVVAAAPVLMQDRMRQNAGLIGGVGVLLLAMLIGVVIGVNAASDPPAPVAQQAPAPQVITVGGGAAAPVAAADPAAAEATPSSSKKKKGATADSVASEADDPKAPTKATSSAVRELDKLTGAAREKAVERLGKNIATGGKAPKRDAKPAAGGGSFEEIG